MDPDLVPPAAGLASRLTARPRYTVLQPLFCEKHYGSGLYAKAELRQYEPSLVAEVSVEADGIVAAVSKAEQDLQAYMNTISEADGRAARKNGDTICPLLRRIDFPVLSGLFKAKAVPICSVQDLQWPGPEDSHLYADGKHVERQTAGTIGSILFAAERHGSLFKIQFLLAPTLSLATMPRPLSTCIRFRLAPIFCFAAYQFNGNSPTSDKVKLKASKLQALCAQHGLETDERQLIVQQHHPRAAPRWLRVNEVMLAVTNYRPAGLQRHSAAACELPHDGKPQSLDSPLSSFCRRGHRTAVGPADGSLTDAGRRPTRWPWLGECCDQPVLIKQYCRSAPCISDPMTRPHGCGRWGYTEAGHVSATVYGSPVSAVAVGKSVLLCTNCSSHGCQEGCHARDGVT